MPHEIPLVTTIAAALAGAWVLGVLARRIGLSPIVGYLLAGILLGPHTPGFVADVGLAGQLAEIGVVLLMFGVGLHFHLKDLLAVKGIAVPGALLQSAATTLLGLSIGLAFGWPRASGLVLGLALAVASTVVLMRALEDRQLLATPHGHAAVGWLLVEDVLTVVILVVIPAVAAGSGSAGQGRALWTSIGVALAKLLALVGLVAFAGSRVVPRMLELAARLRSRELFTLTVLALAVAVATGSALFFGASMALGAFLAGMVVGQSPVSHQAAADALPFRDAFAVLFFVSVGMLFDPAFVVREPALVLSALAVVMVGKPLVALAVVAVLGYPTRTALVAALGLAQVGEFSFILAGLAQHHRLLPGEGYNAIVACAIVSIAASSFVFRALEPLEALVRRRRWLSRLVEGRAESRRRRVNAVALPAIADRPGPLAVVVGYGPVGRTVDRLIREAGIGTVVIDLSLEAVAEIGGEGRLALYGDASHPDILREAGIARASHLVITLPHSLNRGPMIIAARKANPACRILVRARYLRERAELEQAGADVACFEEAEAAGALAERVLRDLGRDEKQARAEGERIRWGFNGGE
jgi:K+:H+ antiporter